METESAPDVLIVYQNDFDVVHKEDNSPLTIADQRANRVIEEHLKTTEIPILSEEGIHLDYDTRKKWEYLCCRSYHKRP